MVAACGLTCGGELVPGPKRGNPGGNCDMEEAPPIAAGGFSLLPPAPPPLAAGGLFPDRGTFATSFMAIIDRRLRVDKVRRFTDGSEAGAASPPPLEPEAAVFRGRPGPRSCGVQV